MLGQQFTNGSGVIKMVGFWELIPFWQILIVEGVDVCLLYS